MKELVEVVNTKTGVKYLVFTGKDPRLTAAFAACKAKSFEDPIELFEEIDSIQHLVREEAISRYVEKTGCDEATLRQRLKNQFGQ